ncbi:VCBS domain-containing protein, partial [Chromobacterium piscinae]
MNVADADQGQSVFNTSRVDNKTTNLGSITIDANGNWHYSVPSTPTATGITASTTPRSSTWARARPAPRC